MDPDDSGRCGGRHRDPDAFAEAVLRVVDRVPPGRVTTYGAVADAVSDRFGGGPRQVGAVMARDGAAVAWWRVVRADGSLPDPLAAEARARHRQEGTPLRSSGRVDLVAAFWEP
ncbi:MAG TPA: MGMT family protein [Microthrixaceae bacterium]|nr:MGMT family protein [Microthrixaceae bacterium]HNL47484.1 MGMT family protein [Microthrixaceae bacterium]